MRLQGFGQWVSEVNPGEENPEDWSGEPTRGMNAPIDPRSGSSAMFGRPFPIGGDGESTITMGPDSIIPVPKGRKLTNVQQHADIADQVLAADKFIRQLLTMESIPPGDILGEARQASGYALTVERLSLIELRHDQIALYRKPTEALITLVRQVWDAHQPDNSTRFGPLRARFTPDAMEAPMDPATENASDAFELQNRLTTRARVIARRNRIPLEDAEQLVAEIDGTEATGSPAPADRSNAGGGDATEPPAMDIPPDEVMETPPVGGSQANY
jgi:hypothetical protein